MVTEMDTDEREHNAGNKALEVQTGSEVRQFWSEIDNMSGSWLGFNSTFRTITEQLSWL